MTNDRSRFLKSKIVLEYNTASVYTKKMFREFQYQLVEASNYFLENDKYRYEEGDENTHYKCFRPLIDINKWVIYHVVFNKIILTGCCDNKMFEHLGISSWHIIVILNKKYVPEIQETFLKCRWSKDASRVKSILHYLYIIVNSCQFYIVSKWICCNSSQYLLIYYNILWFMAILDNISHDIDKYLTISFNPSWSLWITQHRHLNPNNFYII